MQTPINQSMNLLEWAILITLSILWGASFFFVGVLVDIFPPLTIVWLRVGLAAIALNIIVRAMGQKLPLTSDVWIAFFGMGILNNLIPFCLIVWGQTHIASGLASILNAATPIFTILVAHKLTDNEKLSRNKAAGVVIGLLGVAVMIGSDALEELGVNILAQLAILGSCISYAFAVVFGRRFQKMGLAPMHTATGQVTASAILLLPIVCVIDQPWNLAMPGLWPWLAVLGYSLLSTALAYILYFRLLATAGATNLSLVTFLVPVSAILLGVFVLGERLETRHMLGMLLIGAGLLAIDGRVLTKLMKQSLK